MHVRNTMASAGLLGHAVASSTCGSWFSSIPDLSSSTTISCGAQDTRWSAYAAPEPGSIVTVGDEADIAKLVKAATQAKVPFLLQSGGNGWADTFTLGSSGTVFDVSGLKDVTFNQDKTEVTFQTGVTNEDIINAAWSNDARVSASTCNCVSLLGATLGGGLSRIQGVYGLNVDQLISINFVNASGISETITPESNSDLWWALTGAGANFGIVTSATYKAEPIAQADNSAWTGLLFFNETQLEDVITAIDNLTLEPEMQMDMYLAASPLDGKPGVLVLPFYLGTEDVGREKFASILALNPIADMTAVTPYNEWNAAGDAFCTPGGRKPSYTVGLVNMDPTTWRSVWNEFVAFFDANPEANQTSVLTECYSTASTAKSVTNGGSTSYPHRDIKCYGIAIPWYTSPSLDAQATAMGSKIRNYWRSTAGTSAPSSYVNFAHGDEPLDVIYGASLSKLTTLKEQYDPAKLFNQWFPLS
ncbi:FAD binding domain-containing protein [Xylaria intraflava]|nr:FAD binding domain-containing protein [Xylaria intraflava]